MSRHTIGRLYLVCLNYIKAVECNQNAQQDKHMKNSVSTLTMAALVLIFAVAGKTYATSAAPNLEPGAATGGYDISANRSANSWTYDLDRGQIYRLNVTGNFSPSTGASSISVVDSMPWAARFDVGGNVRPIAGSSAFPSMAGSIVAHEQSSLAPGHGDPEVTDGLRNNMDLHGSFHAVTPVPEPTTLIAGALLLLPFAASAFSSRRKRVVEAGRVS
jgi:hypothetical protein